MHLSANETTPNTHHSGYALVPAHARVLVNAGLQACSCLLTLDELSYLLLQKRSTLLGMPYRSRYLRGLIKLKVIHGGL